MLGRMRLPRVPTAAVAALVSVGIGAHWWSVPLPARTLVGVGGLALAVNLLPHASRGVHRLLSLGPLRLLGLWSFSLYLWQQPFYAAVHDHGMNPWVALAAAAACGLASFYFLERPVREWLNRTWASPGAFGSDRR